MQLTPRHTADTRSRAGVVIGFAAAAGVFAAAAMMSAASAASARADDFTEIINAVDSDLTIGQSLFSNAVTDFGSSDVNDGLAALFGGVDEDFVAAPDNLFIGTVEALTNESISPGFVTILPSESNFTSASTFAESLFTEGQNFMTTAGTDLASANYGGAADLYALGSLEWLAASQILVEGAVASF